MSKPPKHVALQNALIAYESEMPLSILISPQTKETMVVWKGRVVGPIESFSMLAVNGALSIKIISPTLIETQVGKEMVMEGIDVISHATGVSGLVLNDARKK